MNNFVDGDTIRYDGVYRKMLQKRIGSFGGFFIKLRDGFCLVNDKKHSFPIYDHKNAKHSKEVLIEKTDRLLKAMANNMRYVNMSDDG